MRLYGRLIKNTKSIKEAVFEVSDEEAFRDALEKCLIGLCRDLDIQVPIWLKKNTTEFVRYRTTSFPREQFVEDIKFDRLDIRLV